MSERLRAAAEAEGRRRFGERAAVVGFVAGAVWHRARGGDFAAPMTADLTAAETGEAEVRARMVEAAEDCCDTVCRGKRTPGCAVYSTPPSDDLRARAFAAASRALAEGLARTVDDPPTRFVNADGSPTGALDVLADRVGGAVLAVLAGREGDRG